MELDQKRVKVLICLVIILATLVAYEPLCHNGFVDYDDNIYITQNPNIKSGITKQTLVWAFTQPHASNWHPLTWLSHTLDYKLFGPEPFGHHLVNLLFHIANALLLFWILTKMTGATWPSAFVAAIFALHPLQVESVAWASERKTVLSGFFWFLTIAVYIRYTKRPGIGRYILLFCVYALSIMAKPVVVTLPLVLLLLDYWPLGRFSTAGVVNPARQAGRLLIEKVPLLILSIVLSAITFIVQRQGGAVIAFEKVPLIYRLGNAFMSYVKYIGKLAWPKNLAVFYPFPMTIFPKAAAIVCVLLVVLITALSILIGLRKRYVTVGWLWYIGTLIPMIGIIQAGSQSMADRYMYLPMLGLLFIFAWAVKDLISNRPRLKVLAAILSTVAIFSCVILTRTQVRYWQNGITLFEHTLKVTEDNAPAEYNCGYAFLNKGRFDEAVERMRKAAKLRPTSLDARRGLGIALLKKGNCDEAIACFNEILQRNNNYAPAYYYLAIAAGIQQRYPDAIKYLETLLTIDPKFPDSHSRMAAMLLETGKTDEALLHLNKALRIDTDPTEAYINFGKVYCKLGKLNLVIENWTKAARLHPDRTDILDNLAMVMIERNEIPPGDAKKAIEYAIRACELSDYKEAEFIDTLAKAYAAAGRFEEAITTADKALDIAKAAGKEALADEIQERIKLYKSGQRYRQK